MALDAKSFCERHAKKAVEAELKKAERGFL